MLIGVACGRARLVLIRVGARATPSLWGPHWNSDCAAALSGAPVENYSALMANINLSSSYYYAMSLKNKIFSAMQNVGDLKSQSILLQSQSKKSMSVLIQCDLGGADFLQNLSGLISRIDEDLQTQNSVLAPLYTTTVTNHPSKNTSPIWKLEFCLTWIFPFFLF